MIPFQSSRLLRLKLYDDAKRYLKVVWESLDRSEDALLYGKCLLYLGDLDAKNVLEHAIFSDGPHKKKAEKALAKAKKASMKAKKPK
jgi:hypothetical protein